MSGLRELHVIEQHLLYSCEDDERVVEVFLLCTRMQPECVLQQLFELRLERRELLGACFELIEHALEKVFGDGTNIFHYY